MAAEKSLIERMLTKILKTLSSVVDEVQDEGTKGSQGSLDAWTKDQERLHEERVQQMRLDYEKRREEIKKRWGKPL